MSALLTESEQRVARYLLGDLTTVEIARILHLSPETVKTHSKNIYRKLGVRGKKDIRRDPNMRRICNGTDPNLKNAVDGKIGNCGAEFDDVTASTICPHKEFGALKAASRSYFTNTPIRIPMSRPELPAPVPVPRPDLDHHHHTLANTGCTADHQGDPADSHAYAVIVMEPHQTMWLTLDIDAARSYASHNHGVIVAMPFIGDYRTVVTDEAEIMARAIHAEGVPPGAAATIAANFHGRPGDARALAERLQVPTPPLDEGAEPAPGCVGYRQVHAGANRCTDPQCGRCWPGFLG